MNHRPNSPSVSPWRIGNGPAPTKLCHPVRSVKPSTGRPTGLGRSSTHTVVDVLDARNASFVSVTRQFNTTTSMGRPTLNMLLSFAQFEREIAGEAHSRQDRGVEEKGMWMGATCRSATTSRTGN